MRILLLGCNGQVGWELQRSLSPLGELIALGHGAGDLCGDLLQPAGLAQTVQTVRPDVIVNAAAYTAVEEAEGDADKAHALNAAAVGVLAEEAEKLGAWMVHYSTDYVFDGRGDVPWTEYSTPQPLSVYGRTKLEGERLLQEKLGRHLLLRTSWIYSARRSNFMRTILALARERDALNVVNDQVGAPTGAELIADVTAHALREIFAGAASAAPGLYHLAAAGETSWYSYARFIFELAERRGLALKVGADTVQPVSSAMYRTRAPRPLNSRLDTRKLESAFSVRLPSWKFGVERTLAELLERDPND